MRRALLLTVLLCLLVPAPAGAAVRHVVNGAGFGHGVGMSQYGAFGFAKEGRTYRQILAHYYRGTEVSPAETRSIRVLLQASTSGTGFSGATQVGDRRVEPERTYNVIRSESGVEVRGSGGALVASFDAPVRVSRRDGAARLSGTAINGIRGGTYKGDLEFRRGLYGGVTVVNDVGIDDYVKGVVPGEVPASWPEEALKAQSVAARTYSLATNVGGAVFDQYPDTRSQVYKGAGSEHPRANAAVDATAGEIVRYKGKIATTFFFSTSGGRTENVENSFSGSSPSPYLKSVEDPFDDESSLHRWRLTFSQAEMQSKLAGHVKGRFRSITVLKRGVSPRITTARVNGSGGPTEVSGATLRARLGLYDTWAFFSRARVTRTATKAERAAKDRRASDSRRRKPQQRKRRR